ncbi:LPXTG cell wall anchor domain-containing protein [Kordia sp. YSTF-M3]|uniref:histidine kinase n=1 Tax=Kordia aestuariivivens TaxID=2759037 RepID=A0ABR7QCT9_9FLAO|nr:ATP-binding protein [Kordia aestuariivivens]MBC8756337.1 LPXTG cell wall anchor domain-containing protein [Kordia aestuariivivens]
MQSQNTETGDISAIIITLVFILMVVAIIALFLVFIKRKNKLLTEKELAKREFENAIAETQIEIREQTLRNISWELHDNIGQLLTLAKIQLHQIEGCNEDISEVTETISKSLTELRALSKLINPDALKNIMLPEALSLEVARFNRLNFIEATLTIKGEEQIIDDKAEIILFRILQEFFSNTIKHAKASKLDVTLTYENRRLTITAKDNGKGFNKSEDASNKGIGLLNMKSRGKLIGAEIELESQLEKGTELTIIHYL